MCERNTWKRDNDKSLFSVFFLTMSHPLEVDHIDVLQFPEKSNLPVSNKQGYALTSSSHLEALHSTCRRTWRDQCLQSASEHTLLCHWKGKKVGWKMTWHKMSDPVMTRLLEFWNPYKSINSPILSFCFVHVTIGSSPNLYIDQIISVEEVWLSHLTSLEFK